MLRNQIDKIRLLFRKDKESYLCFYKILGFYPRNIQLYQQALLHKSTSIRSEKGRPLNNERLEFLGDAILDRKNTCDGFYRTGGTQQVTGHGFC